MLVSQIMSDRPANGDNLLDYIVVTPETSSRLSLIETEMSRLRSVVHLLAKDNPEILRLLGQTPSPADNN